MVHRPPQILQLTTGTQIVPEVCTQSLGELRIGRTEGDWGVGREELLERLEVRAEVVRENGSWTTVEQILGLLFGHGHCSMIVYVKL